MSAATAELPLSRGKVALVDASDFPVLRWLRWHARDKGRTWYAATKINGHNVLLHRFLLQPAAGMEVDHINGDGLDNRRANLRICTHAENARNRLAPAKGRSRFRGVSWHSECRQWRAEITVDHRAKHLGLYESEEDAARVYDAAAVRLHGEFARLNFPREFARRAIVGGAAEGEGGAG